MAVVGYAFADFACVVGLAWPMLILVFAGLHLCGLLDLDLSAACHQRPFSGCA